MQEPDFPFGIRNSRLRVVREDNVRRYLSSWHRDFGVTCSQRTGILESPRIGKRIICLMLLMYDLVSVLPISTSPKCVRVCAMQSHTQLRLKQSWSQK